MVRRPGLLPGRHTPLQPLDDPGGDVLGDLLASVFSCHGFLLFPTRAPLGEAPLED